MWVYVPSLLLGTKCICPCITEDDSQWDTLCVWEALWLSVCKVFNISAHAVACHSLRQCVCPIGISVTIHGVVSLSIKHFLLSVYEAFRDP